MDINVKKLARFLFGELRIFAETFENFSFDFVITYQDQVIAIEVKSGRRTTNEGIRVFVERFNPKSAFVVGSGGVPLEDFLLSDPSLLF
ncbi:MAG: hypothetical protein IJU62_07460 [Muribaculaceae bacterium]|nr:hypothetical protein [Muribaculaceae bacterium]